MLLIDRKHGEAILIDGKIRIVVLRHRGRIRIGIEAPREIAIAREETLETLTKSDESPTNASLESESGHGAAGKPGKSGLSG